MKRLNKMVYLLAMIFITMTGCSENINPTLETKSREIEEAGPIISPQIPDEMEEVFIEESSYKITSESYIENQIILEYPQIRNLGDDVKEHEINDLIKEDIIKSGEGILGDSKNDDIKPALELKYEVKLQTKGILSVLYTGMGVLEGGHYVWFTTHAITIDLENVKKLSLTDFTNVDNELIKKIKESSNITKEYRESGIDQEEFYRIIQDIKEEEIINGLKKGIEPYGFCVAPDSIIVSIERNLLKNAKILSHLDYYQQKQQEGKSKIQALICISRRLVNIVYGMLKNKLNYVRCGQLLHQHVSHRRGGQPVYFI